MSPSVMRSRLLPDGVGRLEQVCFSGRRRHTRWPRDWSSDVCSSDLWLYFTREVFDLFYPSYGDTWPTFNGAVGMTYEQAGHSRAGRGIQLPEGEILTLRDRLEHHYVTGMSTIEITSRHADRVVREFADR